MRRASWLKRRTWLLGLGACALLLATPARAEGPGIKLGDRLLLHLGLAAEFRYDDNFFFQDASQAKVSAFEFVLRPSVDLATSSRGSAGGMVEFRLHAGMAYMELITNRDILAGHRSFSVDAGALMTLFPKGRFNISLFDNFVRTTQPPYGNEPYNLDRDTNQLGVRLQYSPGGKRLTLALSYVFGVDFFENDTFRDYNLFTHGLALYISWRFFPKTALYLSVSDAINKYQHHGTNGFDQPDSYPLHAELGVMGLITPKLSVNAYIGYGYGFIQYDAAAVAAGRQVDQGSPNTAVGGLNLSWKPTLLSTGNIGYKYDFANSLLGAYYDAHQVYINWTQLIWRFTGAIALRYSNIHYHGVAPNTQTDALGDSRIDNSLGFDLRLDYPFKDWLVASFGYDLQYNATPAHLVTNPMMPMLGLIPLGYLKNEVWLRIGVLY
jgi:hypothetical protein